MAFLPDATDFTDIPLMPKGDDAKVSCPKCFGHGYWNLTLNAYGPGKHFKAFCGQCWGWGWVKGTDATCLHDFKAIAPAQPFRCYHTDQCQKCGRTRSYSSDD